MDTVQYMTKREKQAIKIERIVLERPELVGSFIYKTLVDPAEGVSSADRGNDPDTNTDTNTGDAKFQNLE